MVNLLDNHNAVRRTALATQGLLSLQQSNTLSMKKYQNFETPFESWNKIGPSALMKNREQEQEKKVDRNIDIAT